MGHPKIIPSAEPLVTFSSGRDLTEAPALRILHYNDVYHIDPSSAEPVGGIGRFMTVVREYRDGSRFEGQPELIPLFSGDSFNPSVESTVTKGPSTSQSLVPFRVNPADGDRFAHGPHPQRHWNASRRSRGIPSPPLLPPPWAGPS